MSSSQAHFENGWGYKLELGKGVFGFLLFVPPSNENTTLIEQLKFTPTKFSYDGYSMWVTVAKGRRITEIIGFFKRYNIPLFSEEEIIEVCFPFTKIYKPRRG
jgi:hypothetical protein